MHVDFHNVLSLYTRTAANVPALDYFQLYAVFRQNESQILQFQGLWVEDSVLHITGSPARRIDFMFGTRRVSACIAEPGNSVTSAAYPLPQDGIYVRVTVTDHNEKHANTNAYFLNELLEH